MCSTSTSENGKIQSNDDQANSKDDNEAEKQDFSSSNRYDHSDNVESSELPTCSDADGGTNTAVTTASSFAFLKNQGSKSSYTFSPLRPSVLGGGCASTSSSSSFSSSVFGSSVCSPSFSSTANNFPRNLFSKSSFSCTRAMENRSPVFHKPVLRPSQLANPGLADSSTSKNSNPFVLNPPKLTNPFAKINSNSDEPSRTISVGDSPSVKDDKSSDNASKTQDNDVTSTAAGQLEKPPQQQGCSKTNTPPSTMAFVPLSTPSNNSPSTPIRLPSSNPTTPLNIKTTTPNATPGGFVFGQNLHERVIVEPSGSDIGASSSSDTQSIITNDVVTPSTDSAATNGTSSEMLFTSVIQKELPEKTMEGGASLDDKSRKSLSESAREYEESRAVKRKYEEVAVVTGEEEENNILQMDCKLFVYDGSKFNYSEGVHGSLRVNDPTVSAKKVTQSRVIVRMSGTLRVLMNTKIWAGMKIEKPNRKIVRMTAMDSAGQIKVFLISSSPAESDLLYRVLESRILLQKELTGACRNGNLDENDKADSSTQ